MTVGLVLVLLGALTKSAQVPFHSWLPGAMAAPTPISAYLHSATMVKAGVYLIARFAPAFATVGPWRRIVLGCGGASMLLGGYRALRQHDLKLRPRLRHHQPARPADGALRRRDARAGVRRVRPAHRPRRVQGRAVPHRRRHRPPDPHPRPAGASPASAAGSRSSPRARRSPPPRWPASRRCSASSPRSWPSTALLGDDVPARWVLLAVVVVGSMFTVAYSARFVWGAFGPADTRRGLERTLVGPEAPAPLEGRSRSRRWSSPGSVCCSASCPPSSARWSTTRGRPSATRATPRTSRLWHGFTVPLGLSALVIAGGALLFLARDRVERWQAAVPAVPSAAGPTSARSRACSRAPARSPVWCRAARCRCTSPCCSSPWWSCPACPLVASGGPSSVAEPGRLADPAGDRRRSW